LNKFLRLKKKLFLRYCKEFSKINKIRLIKNPHFSKSNNWLNTIFIKNSSIKKRNKVLSFAQKNQIFLRPVWKPLHTLKHFNKMPRMKLDVAIKIYKSCINLPSSASYFDIKK
jgi:perosamine synthetase